MTRTLRAALALLALALITACATAPETHEAYGAPAYDPFEPVNRAVYTFNDRFDRYLARPVARGYRAVVPRPVRTGVSNFFANLWEPAIMVNDLLQGKVGDAASDLGRFLANSTLGVFGLFDVATGMGLERHNEDLGQTFGVWGFGPGPYLVLPFFGASSVRDGVGLYGDLQMYPPTYLNDESTRWSVYVLDFVDTRARLLDAGDILEQAAGEDPYVFMREAYLQRRRGLVSDGGTEEPAPLDPSIFEDEEAPPGDEGAPAR